MELNFITFLLALLIYFPIFFLGLISKNFKIGFMKVHARRKSEYALETIVGINYFIIFSLFLLTSFTTNQILFFTGLVIFLIGIIITFAGYYRFYTSPPETLVLKWPYSISRNPTYFYGFISLLGLSIQTSSIIHIVLISLQLFFTHYIILAEEEYCKEKYHNEYLSYKTKVRRYI